MGYYTYIFPAERARRSDSPVAMSTSSAKVLVSNAILYWKQLGLLEEMTDSRGENEE